MKKIIVLAALLVAFVGVSAQTTFGVRAGMNLSSFVGDDTKGLESKIGFNVGAIADIQLSESFYVQPGLFLTTKGCKFTDDGDDYTINPMYLQLPILASYRYNISDELQLQVNAGPYLAYGIGGKMKVDDIDVDVFGDDGLKYDRFDAGVAVGVGMNIQKFYVGLQYERGLIKIQDSLKGFNSNFSVSVGYNF